MNGCDEVFKIKRQRSAHPLPEPPPAKEELVFHDRSTWLDNRRVNGDDVAILEKIVGFAGVEVSRDNLAFAYLAASREAGGPRRVRVDWFDSRVSLFQAVIPAWCPSPPPGRARIE